ncbi:protein-tyrosine phosphatase family protein [Amycolatopsis jiangsuensis]|uniref:Protein-tyrosine phosphatase n=1 Tax=Amycolatopsis jiangsuensis TaxID=1181879 RepID=A0A840IWL8_9PSEU|nr:protein tyrosine phosphatase [Amycolatopsis jiangsuensis]MBB4686250.1 protein-tyrosine phosphatase [Amycolatopsis jiangsuensis]
MASGSAGTLVLPDGAAVRPRGLRHPRPPGPEPVFGLYLGSRRLRAKHEASLHWDHEWIRWPDFLLPLDWAAARRDLRALHARAAAGEAVELACHGGVGRTGTALACLATLGGLGPDEAVTWVRENYNGRAVETPWQQRWIRWFANSGVPH